MGGSGGSIGVFPAFLWLTADSRQGGRILCSYRAINHAPGKDCPVVRGARPASRPRPGAPSMPISDVPILSMLRTKMQWHQERQKLLAENVSNADTPRFKPHDLAPLKFDQNEPPAGGGAALAAA